MTHEEAARILDPETTQEALDEIKYYAGFRGEEAWAEASIDARRIAADALRNLQQTCNNVATSCTPLTLEQLREMDRPTPVWAEVDGKTIEGWNGYWCLCHHGKVLAPGRILMNGDSEEGVTFYAYPPARIDREGWGDCPVCGTYQLMVFKAWRDEYSMNRGPEAGGGVKFCPHCGRPRTPEAWAELEKRMGVRG